VDLEKIMEGARYHEAGHAVAAYYNGFTVTGVTATPEETITNWRCPYPSTWADSWRRACVTMAGQLADQQASWGEIRPESWEEFRQAAEDALEAFDYGDEDALDDHVEILEDLERMSDEPGESYRSVVRDARALVSEHWGEIAAVARGLERTGHLDGPEFVRIMEEAGS
jgi:hypothetical protein